MASTIGATPISISPAEPSPESGGTVSFYLPLDVNGLCCSGNFIVFATPDYSPSTPEPSSLLLFGSGILGVGGLLRRRFLGWRERSSMGQSCPGEEQLRGEVAPTFNHHRQQPMTTRRSP